MTPWAHIRTKTMRGNSLCGVAIKTDEWGFEDAAYAVQFYANGTHLRACPQCVEAEREAGRR